MKTIILTLSNDLNLYLQAEFIQSFTPRNEVIEGGRLTLVQMVSKDVWAVKEKPETILKLLAEVNK